MEQHWFKQAVIYCLDVETFQDSNGDGIGDIAGLTRRLAVAGIRADLEGDQLAFGFAQPANGALHLARPVAHPWLPERTLAAIPLAVASAASASSSAASLLCRDSCDGVFDSRAHERSFRPWVRAATAALHPWDVLSRRR